MNRPMSLALLVVCLALVCGTRASYAANVGPIWAEKVTAYDVTLFGFIPFDHPYVCVEEGECYAFHGRHAGGNALAGSRGEGDRDTTRCVAQARNSCAVIWGVTGTSHQEANRLLWPADTKVTSARGYWVLYPRFGHYGDSPLWSPTWTLCQRACTQ